MRLEGKLQSATRKLDAFNRQKQNVAGPLSSSLPRKQNPRRCVRRGFLFAVNVGGDYLAFSTTKDSPIIS